MFPCNYPKYVSDRGRFYRFHGRTHRTGAEFYGFRADQPVSGSDFFIWNGWKTVRDPDLAGSSVGGICRHHRHGSRILPGDARNEAESVGGDTE